MVLSGNEMVCYHDIIHIIAINYQVKWKTTHPTISILLCINYYKLSGGNKEK